MTATGTVNDREQDLLATIFAVLVERDSYIVDGDLEARLAAEERLVDLKSQLAQLRVTSP